MRSTAFGKIIVVYGHIDENGVAEVLKESLRLLGVKAPDEM